MNSIKDSLSKISESFSKESLLGSTLFFLVLSSWYILRPVRNEMAVANANELPYLLSYHMLHPSKLIQHPYQ